MIELIDRQALKAAHGLATDCGNCKQNARSCQYDRDFSRMDFCEWLDDAPTIDAVPVVRCGECIHFTQDGWCDREFDWFPVDENDFCSMAEKMEVQDG